MFKKGQSGNPAGRPKGSKNVRARLTEDFLMSLADDWQLHGDEALERGRRKDPIGYVKVVASLLPKELAFTRPLEDLTDNELEAVAEYLRSRKGAGTGGEGDRDSGSPEPTSSVPTVQ